MTIVDRTKPRFLDIQAGDELPLTVETATNLSTFLVDVAWWASHRIHYDLEEARREGFRDVVVPGVHIYQWIEKLLTRWAGDPACVRRLSFRNQALAFVGDKVALHARVSGKPAPGIVELVVKVTNDAGVELMSCQATLRLTDDQV